MGPARGLSELEKSRLDGGVPGKAMWSTDEREENVRPPDAAGRPEDRSASRSGHKTLSVFIHVEPFDNGARPIVEIRLREDRPREVALSRLRGCRRRGDAVRASSRRRWATMRASAGSTSGTASKRPSTSITRSGPSSPDSPAPPVGDRRTAGCAAARRSSR